MPAVPMSAVQIADDLAARIRAGEYRPGDKLPSYSQLAELYSVKHGTIARVMLILRDRGVVIGAPGRGVFVATPTV